MKIGNQVFSEKFISEDKLINQPGMRNKIKKMSIPKSEMRPYRVMKLGDKRYIAESDIKKL